MYDMVWNRALGWDRYEAKAKAAAIRAELRLEMVTRILLHRIWLTARTFSLLGLADGAARHLGRSPLTPQLIGLPISRLSIDSLSYVLIRPYIPVLTGFG